MLHGSKRGTVRLRRRRNVAAGDQNGRSKVRLSTCIFNAFVPAHSLLHLSQHHHALTSLSATTEIHYLDKRDQTIMRYTGNCRNFSIHERVLLRLHLVWSPQTNTRGWQEGSPSRSRRSPHSRLTRQNPTRRPVPLDSLFLLRTFSARRV